MKLNNIFNKIIHIQKDFPNQPPEKEVGNKEYKWKLIPDSYHNVFKKKNKIASQMKYRLYEGNGKAIYLIGVTDSGRSVGLCQNDIYKSIKFINDSAEIIKTNIDKIRLYKKGSNFIATIRLSNQEISDF